MNVISTYERFKVKLFGPPTEQAKRCWLFHSWAAYGEMHLAGYALRSRVRTMMTQFRRCERCGILQAKQRLLK